MSRARPGVDPDIEQAIDDMLPLVPQLAAAKKKLSALPASATLSQANAARVAVVSLRADVATRAERIGTTGPALLVILGVEADLRKSNRRPPRPLVERALQDAAIERRCELVKAQAALAAAQAEVGRVVARVAAVHEAQRAFVGAEQVRVA